MTDEARLETTEAKAVNIFSVLLFAAAVTEPALFYQNNDYLKVIEMEYVLLLVGVTLFSFGISCLLTLARD